VWQDEDPDKVLTRNPALEKICTNKINRKVDKIKKMVDWKEPKAWIGQF